MILCISKMPCSLTSACLCSTSFQEDRELDIRGSSYTHQVPRWYFYLIGKKIVVHKIHREKEVVGWASAASRPWAFYLSPLYWSEVYLQCVRLCVRGFKGPRGKRVCPCCHGIWAWSLLCPSSIFTAVSAQRVGSTLFWGLVPLQAAFSLSHPRSRLFKTRFPYPVKPGTPGATE